jgi:putative cardiolipin synthase
VPAVNSHYKQWRKPLLEAGVELHEMRHDAAVQPLLADTPPTRAEFMGLHVKAMVIDRQRVFIGSMNLDPRSWDLNSEMGVVVESEGLARALAAAMERDMRPENAWRVTLGPDGEPRWTAGDATLTSQPARSFWQRVEDVIFMAFPRDLY